MLNCFIHQFACYNPICLFEDNFLYSFMNWKTLSTTSNVAERSSFSTRNFRVNIYTNLIPTLP